MIASEFFTIFRRVLHHYSMMNTLINRRVGSKTERFDYILLTRIRLNKAFSLGGKGLLEGIFV